MVSEPRRRKRKPRYERRIFALALGTGVPAAALALFLLWRGDFAARTQWTLTIVLFVVWLGFVGALWERVVRPLQTISNMLAALREGDFSLRARGSDPDDALGLSFLELNSLGEDLRAQRLSALEATALLRRVMEEIDVAVFAFDEARALRLVNRGGAALLERPVEQLLGKDAAELGLAHALAGDAPRVLEMAFPGRPGVGRWELRRGTFRQGGLPHQLLVLSDVSRALREEERRAWQRLVRVLGHELNNSLAPIKSIAGSLHARLMGSGIRNEEQQDFQRGLSIIESRAASLNRFLQGYHQLAQMPPPALQRCSIALIAKRVAALETRAPVAVIPGPEIDFLADPDQLEQMLINLVRNAADAVLQVQGAENHSNGSKSSDTEQQIVFSWKTTAEDVIISIQDNGPGLMNPSNAFVPFYTTKPTGSGIGLVLSRQIAEAHGGSLELSNRTDQRGCLVRVTLPMKMAQPHDL